ncbi:hypothetical protein ACVW16_005338 [Bradyrhizobium sp. USDA 4474]
MSRRPIRRIVVPRAVYSSRSRRPTIGVGDAVALPSTWNV